MDVCKVAAYGIQVGQDGFSLDFRVFQFISLSRAEQSLSFQNRVPVFVELVEKLPVFDMVGFQGGDIVD